MGEAAIREKSQSIAETIASLNVELAGLEAEAGAVEHAMKELRTLQSGLSTDQDQRREMIAACGDRDAELRTAIREKESALAARREERTACEERVKAVAAERLALEAQRTQADKDARAKNEELLALERDCARLEQKKNAAEMEEKQLLDKLWDNYELSHSEAALKQRQELENRCRRPHARIARAEARHHRPGHRSMWAPSRSSSGSMSAIPTSLTSVPTWSRPSRNWRASSAPSRSR